MNLNNLTMVQFNEIFQKKMQDVRILEKTNSKMAISAWIDICKLIVNFTKSPGCPRDLRPKLINQADSIVVKVKHYKAGHIKSVFDNELKTDQTKIEHISSSSHDIVSSLKELGGQDESKKDEEMLNKLQSLPTIPVNTEEKISNQTPQQSSEQPPEKPSEKPPEKPTEQAPKQSSEKASEQSISKSSQNSIDSLKTIPPGVKEVNPSPFSNQEILAKKDSSLTDYELKSFENEPTTLDITSGIPDGKGSIDLSAALKKASHPQSGPKDVSIFGVKATPFSKTDKSKNAADSNQSKVNPFVPSNPPKEDPFGPDSVKNEIKKGANERLCFACGAPLKQDSNICPQCGAEN